MQGRGRTPHSAYFSRRGNLQWPEHAKRLSRNSVVWKFKMATLGCNTRKRNPPATARMKPALRLALGTYRQSRDYKQPQFT